MYKLQFNTDHPGHVVFLLDLSGSMNDDNKIDYVIDAVDSTIRNLAYHCVEGSVIKERLTISVYGYNYRIVRLLENASIKEVGAMIKAAKVKGLKLFDRNVDAKPEFQTCMCMAFEETRKDVQAWIARQHSAQVPAPIVVNITDGFPYEGEKYDQKEVFARTLRAAQALMAISTADGNVRLFNIHFDPRSAVATLRFPASAPSDERLRFLYDASTPLTAVMATSANLMGFPEAREGAKVMVSNEKEPSKLTSFVDWGSSQPVRPVPDAR